VEEGSQKSDGGRGKKRYPGEGIRIEDLTHRYD